MPSTNPDYSEFLSWSIDEGKQFCFPFFITLKIGDIMGIGFNRPKGNKKKKTKKRKKNSPQDVRLHIDIDNMGRSILSNIAVLGDHGLSYDDLEFIATNLLSIIATNQELPEGACDVRVVPIEGEMLKFSIRPVDENEILEVWEEWEAGLKEKAA